MSSLSSRSLLISAVMACACLSACAGPSARLSRTETPPGVPGGLRLPAPSALARVGQPAAGPAGGGRGASFFPEPSIVRLGSEYRSDLPSQRAAIDSDDLLFSPEQQTSASFAGLAYAIYHFETPAPERQPELRLIWHSAPPAGHVFIGVANFAADRWDWPAVTREVGPPDRDLVALAAWAPYLAQDGKLYVAVVLDGTQAASLWKLRAGEPYMTFASVNPTSGIRPFQTHCDLFYSYIPGSDLTGFAVDFDGDGDTDSESMSSDYIYNLAGTYEITATVFNDEGLSASQSLTVYALAGTWGLSTPAPAALDVTNSWPRSGLIAGRPAFAYLHDQTGAAEIHQVEYMIASDALATAWLGPYVAFSLPAEKPVCVGGLLDCGGAPGIFVRTEGGILYFVRGDAPEPASWSEPKLLAGSLSEESGIACGYAAQQPAVAYTLDAAFVGWTLWFQRADSVDGTGEWPVVALVGEGKGDVGLCADGFNTLRAAVHRPFAGDVAIYRADTSTGESSTTWPLVASLPSGALTAGAGPALIPTNTFPVDLIMYSYNGLPGGGVTRAVNLQTQEADSVLIDADAWFSPVYYILDGRQCFSAYDSELGNLYFYLCRTASASISSEFNMLVDEDGDVGRRSSLVAPLGIPIITYEDVTHSSIKVAVMH